MECRVIIRRSLKCKAESDYGFDIFLQLLEPKPTGGSIEHPEFRVMTASKKMLGELLSGLSSLGANTAVQKIMATCVSTLTAQEVAQLAGRMVAEPEEPDKSEETVEGAGERLITRSITP